MGAAAARSPNTPEKYAHFGAALIFLLAAAATIRGSLRMGGDMPMPGGWAMPMMWMTMPGQSAWIAAWMFLVMWQAMMVAMMLPSTWPMLALYRRVASSTQQKRIGAGTFASGAGYFLVWLAFGAAAFASGLGISAAAMRAERASRLVPAGAGVALILAGIYQLSPLKQACLRHCRSPLLLLGHLWRPGLLGAFRIGLAHGAYCAACCWALMLIQMILGVMNLGVMAAVAGVIAIEKLWRRGPWFARLVGGLSIALGVFQLIAGLRHGSSTIQP